MTQANLDRALHAMQQYQQSLEDVYILTTTFTVIQRSHFCCAPWRICTGIPASEKLENVANLYASIITQATEDDLFLKELSLIKDANTTLITLRSKWNNQEQTGALTCAISKLTTHISIRTGSFYREESPIQRSTNFSSLHSAFDRVLGANIFGPPRVCPRKDSE